ncbi:hypothetical protein ACH5RR_039841 [Cinchona calisaya]|uniref:Uncharacterized protein n=1 Tax=Cinchona calisaya TaxID=153742 RepID=A0ABD2Y514_9GENT
MLLYEHTWLESVLEEIDDLMSDKSIFGDELWDQILVVVEELERLRTFALCTARFDGKQVVGEKPSKFWRRERMNKTDLPDPIDVCCHFEDALRKATSEIRRAPKQSFGTGPGIGKESKMDNECLIQAVSKLRDTMKVFRPKIVEAYAHLSSTCFPPEKEHMINWDFLVLLDLIKSANFDLKNLVDRYEEEKEHDQFQLPESVWLSVKALARINASLFKFLRLIQITTPTNPNCIAFLNHFACVFVRAAYFSYSWRWMRTDGNDQMDHQKGKEEIVDLLKQVMPKSPEAIDLCIGFLRSNESFSRGIVAYNFVGFLIPDDADRNGLVMPTFRDGLADLIIFVIQELDLYDNDMKMLLTEVTALASELGGLSYFFYLTENIPKEALQTLVKLTENTELLKVQLLLLKLQKLRYFTHEGVQSYVQNLLHSIHQGLSFLPTFILKFEPHRVKVQNNKTVWTDAETLACEATSVYVSFCANSITREVATFEMVKLLDRIKLFKVEVFLMRLLDSQTVLIANVKNQIQDLYEGLKFIRTFIMSPLDEIGKLILTSAENMMRDASFLWCYSLHSREITEDMFREMNLSLPELLEKMKLVKDEIMQSYLQIRSSLQSNFPKYSGFGVVHFLLGNLRELLNQKADTIASVEHLIVVAYNEIEEIVKSFHMDIAEQLDDQYDLRNLRSRIVNMAYEAEYLVDSFVTKVGIVWYHVVWLSDLIEELILIRIQVSELSEKAHETFANNVEHSMIDYMVSPASFPYIDEVVVDLDDQAKLMIDRLTRGTSQQDVISIVGMPGLGKTTLAKKLYTDPSVTYHFHVRAWCVVSQGYQKRKLLLDLLSDIVELTDDILEMTDDDLDFKLYQCLKQRRYLVVLDDLWSIEAWNDLETSLPNDKNGSRILITSRLPDVVSKVRFDCTPHPLRLLSDDESWQLLVKKLFQTEDCPDELAEIGKQIARSCKGLPLAVVAISGLLRRTERNLWNEVAESLSSRFADDPETRCMDILEISYKHLPNYLKPCFLYIGAFPEDHEIPVWKLICLWIAEGFIQNAESKSLEDAAEDYLNDLIGRSLITASKRRSNGGVKTCRIHDMMLAMCLGRCKEENFLQVVSGYDRHFDSSFEDLDYGVDSSYSNASSSITYETLRLSICSKRNHLVMLRPSGPLVRSLSFFATRDTYPRCPYNIAFIPQNYKLLRVLDIEHINIGNSFPSGVEDLIHLRYLAICGDIDSIPASVANLWNLQTLLVKGLKGKVVLPSSIWCMEKLRHLHVNNHVVFSLQDNKTADPFQSHSLVTLSTPFLYGKDTEKVMRMLFKLRKLRCVFSESQGDAENQYEFPVLNFLMEIESLNVYFSGRIAHPHKFEFPLSLKKLTLSKFRLPWDYISEIGKLPNLEVLKLQSRSFEGKRWDMREGEFLKLKFLKLDTLNIAQWKSSSDHLPNLQRLVLKNCRQLEKVPSDFGDIATLQIIEVQLCRPSVEESVRRLKEEQLEMGIEELQVLINGSKWEFCSSS